MPPIPPAQLVPGRQYTFIQRAQPGHRNGRGTSRRFIQLNAQTGWPRFNAGHGATGLENPTVFNFYNINDPMSGMVVPGATAAAEGAVAPGSGGKRKSKSRKMKRRMIKKRKTLRRK